LKELTDRALNLAQLKGAAYGDIRIIHLVIAKASALVKRKGVELGPPEVHKGSYRTPVKIDPFSIPLEEKIALLLAADGEMRKVKGITVAESGMIFIRENQIFASTEGSYIEQEIIESGAGLEAMATSEDEVQTRSYPNSFGRHQATAGYEFIESMGLVENAQRIAEEAVALLTAKQCASGITTLILGGTQLALQIHESCGHPIELDRVMGTEASYAGTSFLTLEKLGDFRYGSGIVNIRGALTISGSTSSSGRRSPTR